MNKKIISIILAILALLTLVSCTPIEEGKQTANGTTAASTTSAGTTLPQNGEKEPEKAFENKTVFKTEHFEIDTKMTKYLYAYLLNVYYQYYGQYASFYVTPELVEAQSKELLMYCEAAKAEGYELTAEDLAEIADSISALEKSLKENGYDTVADYYGEGVDAEAIIKAAKLQYLSQKFTAEKSEKIYDSLMSDKEALEKYYDGHKELMFGTSFSAKIDDEAYYARLAAAKTKDEIKVIVNEYCEKELISSDEVMGERMVYYPELKEGETLSAFEAWFFDGSRQRGEFFADAETKTVYIVSLPGKKYEELLKSAGHILIVPESNTEEHKAAAKKKAEDLLANYLAGEKTKDAFEAIAKDNTKDGNVFYENIYLGQMVEPFSDWVYDTSREEGDTGIVETEYGYHIMYFVGNGELKNYEYFAFSNMYDKAMTELDAGVKEKYSVTVDKDALSAALS